MAKAYKQSKSKRAGFNSGMTEPLKEKQRRAKIIESNHNKFVMRTGKEYLYGKEVSSPSNRKNNQNSSSGSFSVSMNAQGSSNDVDGIRSCDSWSSQGRDSLVSTTLDDLKSVPTLGALNLRKIQDTDGLDPLVSKQKSVSEELSARDLLNQQRDKEELKKKQQIAEKKFIDLNSPITKTFVKMPENSEASRRPMKTVTAAELRKMKAVAKLKKTETNSESDRRERIMKRVLDNRNNDENSSKEKPDEKKRKVGISNEEKSAQNSKSIIESVLGLKSKFSTELDEIEKEHHEKYFNTKEKKEKIEERLTELMEIKVRAVTCKTCRYVYNCLETKKKCN